MGPFLVLWFGLITVFFLIIAGGCFIYLLMGFGQLITGYREKNDVKKRSGWITILIVVAILAVIVYYYMWLIL
jgi:hypothetical protein